MLAADRFCRHAKATTDKNSRETEWEELKLKISQCRGILMELQEAYNNEKLTVENTLVRMQFRNLITGLLWIGFHMRHVIDRKIFRRLIVMESAFTYVLSNEIRTTRGA